MEATSPRPAVKRGHGLVCGCPHQHTCAASPSQGSVLLEYPAHGLLVLGNCHSSWQAKSLFVVSHQGAMAHSGTCFSEEQYLNTEMDSFPRHSYKARAFQSRLHRVSTGKWSATGDNALVVEKIWRSRLKSERKQESSEIFKKREW